MKDTLSATLDDIRAQGLYKAERTITTSQGARVRVDAGEPVLNMCANNYLGLAQHPRLVEALDLRLLARLRHAHARHPLELRALAQLLQRGEVREDLEQLPHTEALKDLDPVQGRAHENLVVLQVRMDAYHPQPADDRQVGQMFL